MMNLLYQTSDKPIRTFSLIYFITLLTYLLLRQTGFNLAQAFNANVIGLLALIFMSMMAFIRCHDNHTHDDNNTRATRLSILILQIMSFATLIMITPSIIEW